MSEVTDPNRTKDIAAALGLCYTYRPQVAGMAAEIVKLITQARADGEAKRKAPEGHIIDDQGVVRKVLGTLPVTRDGVVVGSGMHSVYKLGTMSQVPYLVVAGTSFDALFDCYSTHAAAEAARGEK